MKPCFICLMLFFILFCSSKLVRSKDSCSRKINPNNLAIPLDTSSLRCIPVWPAHNLLVRYAKVSADTINMVLSFPADIDSYVAIGLSNNSGMVGSTAIVAWFNNSQLHNLLYSLNGKTPDQVIPLNHQPRTDTGNSQTAYLYYGETPLPETPYLLLAIGPKSFFPSSSDKYRLTKHRDYIVLKINYDTGRVMLMSSANLRRGHGGLNIVGWSLILMIGAMIARYCKKWDPLWFYLHASVQTLGFLAGIAGIICGWVLSNEVHVTHHKNIGILIPFLGFLQIIALVWRERKESTLFRKYWNYYHHNVGRLLLFFAFVNTFYGLHLARGGPKWLAGYGISISLLIIVAIILEIRIRIILKTTPHIQLGHPRSPADI